jgi:hypothetical protein
VLCTLSVSATQLAFRMVAHAVGKSASGIRLEKGASGQSWGQKRLRQVGVERFFRPFCTLPPAYG